MLRHIRRRLFCGIRPWVITCTISTTSQMMPKVTCSPWVPTRVKNDDRKALRQGPAPSAIMWANSFSSRPRKAAPNRPVTASQISMVSLRSRSMSSMAKP